MPSQPYVTHCPECGTGLTGKYKSLGRCAKHYRPKPPESPEKHLTADAKTAKQFGMSYGEYIAAKEARAI